MARLLYRGVAMIKCLIEEGRLIAIVLVTRKRATNVPRDWAAKSETMDRAEAASFPAKKLSHGEITMPITIFIAALPLRP